MGGEINDVFYIITIQTDGILRFTLTPNNLYDDYDWSMFNMTNADCSQLYPDALELQVSCNSFGYVLQPSGATGINTLLGNCENCNGPSASHGPPFNKDLDVLAGETYLLNISNYSNSQEGYTLDFSASTATIYDDVPPVIDSILEEVPCSGMTELYFRFSENVLCEDVYHQEGSFTLTGPGGVINITDVTNEDCEIGANQSPGYYLQLDTIINTGSYILTIVGDIHDLCSNVALYESYPFELTQPDAPVAGAGNDTTITNGISITLDGSGSAGTPPFSYHWEPETLLIDPNVEDPTTISMGASTIFTLIVTDSMDCYDEDEVEVTVLGGSLGVVAMANPGTVCVGESVQLNAIGTGGSGNYTYSWSSDPPGFSSTLPDPVVLPNTTTTYAVELDDGFSLISGTTTVTVNPLPVAHAGPDVSIPFGSTTTLHGSASGGSGNYNWMWSSNPPGFISLQQNPETPDLEETTVFYLLVTDQATGCQSIVDEVIVSVNSGALAVNPVAIPPIMCQGNSVQLLPLIGGGTGNYSYNWTSDPSGFSSTEASPVATPMETTTYFLTVNDGYNQASGMVHVVVNPSPQVYLGPLDTTVCIYDSVVLDAGNPGSVYYWSNGATGQTMQIGAAGIGFEMQTYSVKAINEYNCVDSATINVAFSVAACTGINEQIEGMDIHLFPNPTTGMLTLFVGKPQQPVYLSITNMIGQEVFRETLYPVNSMKITRQYDLTGLPAGCYVLKVTGARQSIVRRIILE